MCLKNHTNIGIAILSSFISTNIFWVSTITYVFDVVELDEPPIITGFAAANKLIELYGISAYLNSAYGYFGFVLVFLLVASFIIKPKTKWMISLSSTGCGLVGAITYYMFSVSVRIQDSTTGTDLFLHGLDAVFEIVSENGFIQVLIPIFGLWIIMSITIFLDLLIKNIVAGNIGGRTQGSIKSMGSNQAN